MSNRTFEVTQDDFKPIDEGQYECLVTQATYEYIETTGREYMKIVFKVRGDVEQEGKNRLLFKMIWTDKETGEFPQYSIDHLNKIARACGFEKGERYELADLSGKSLICNVVVQEKYNSPDEYENQVNWYAKTKIGDAVQTLDANTPQGGQTAQEALKVDNADFNPFKTSVDIDIEGDFPF